VGVPLRQSLAVGWHIFKNRLKGTPRFPLVLMLEPLFRCNLECAGCGKIQYPEEVLQQRLSPEQCFEAAEECGAPVVSIAGGEPLIHPEIVEIVNGLVLRGRFVYLCTNAILLERNLHRFRPSVRLTFSIHLDGLGARHDELVCREGVFEKAVGAIKAAKQAGFRVTTNSTIFEGEPPEDVRRFLEYSAELGSISRRSTSSSSRASGSTSAPRGATRHGTYSAGSDRAT
jgi:hopanoid biosynthesis associated radical SAM protein HpnH